jgi:uncharacterized spore protein YtfJ
VGVGMGAGAGVGVGVSAGVGVGAGAGVHVKSVVYNEAVCICPLEDQVGSGDSCA